MCFLTFLSQVNRDPLAQSDDDGDDDGADDGVDDGADDGADSDFVAGLATN